MAALMIGITGCTDTTNTRDAAQTDKGFDQTMAVADSLYNCMQFREDRPLEHRPPDAWLPEYAGQHVWHDEGL